MKLMFALASERDLFSTECYNSRVLCSDCHYVGDPCLQYKLSVQLLSLGLRVRCGATHKC